MKHMHALPLALILALTPLAATAQQEGPLPIEEEATPGEDPGALEQMRRGLGLILDGLAGGLDDTAETMGEWAAEAGPAFRSFIEQMGPALRGIVEEVQDWSVYEAPEILPNGDVIIRRKADAPPYEPTPENETGEPGVEL